MSMNTSLSHNYVLDKIKDIKVGIITSQWNDDITLLLPQHTLTIKLMYCTHKSIWLQTFFIYI